MRPQYSVVGASHADIKWFVVNFIVLLTSWFFEYYFALNLSDVRIYLDFIRRGLMSIHEPSLKNPLWNSQGDPQLSLKGVD